MKWIRRTILAAVVLAGAVFIGWIAFTALFRSSWFELYVARLDTWSRGSGAVDTVRNEVVANCEKLVMTQASGVEVVRFLTIDTEEFDFRVDVCVKMTVNRIHKQPEFENPAILKMICDGKSEFFKKLCARSGLKPA